MGMKLRLAFLLLAATALTTAVLAIDYLKGTTYWDVAEIKGITVQEFHPIPWRFQSYDESASAGVVEATGAWAGTWKATDCKTIYCEINGGIDSWYLTFVNPRYFVAYKIIGENYPLYRLGKMRGEPYNLNTIVAA